MILSNLKKSAIESKLKYLRTTLKNEGKYLDPTGMRLLNKQLREVKAQLDEANARNVIGKTEDGLAVYIAPFFNESKTEVVDTLFIESLPVYWDVASLSLAKDRTIRLWLDEEEAVDFTVDRDMDA